MNFSLKLELKKIYILIIIDIDPELGRVLTIKF